MLFIDICIVTITPDFRPAETGVFVVEASGRRLHGCAEVK